MDRMPLTQIFLYSQSELSADWQRFLSLILLLCSLLLSFIEYERKGFIALLTLNSTLTFYPQLISTIIALSLVCPLYLRGIIPWNRSIYTLLGSALIVLVIASFVELSTGGNGSELLYYLIILSVVLSWVGVRGVAGISWIITIGVSSFQIIENNNNLGFLGAVYILAGFFGVSLFTGLNPGELMERFKAEYSRGVKSAISQAGSDIS
jgi:flagellar biosynthesis protein FliQ